MFLLQISPTCLLPVQVFSHGSSWFNVYQRNDKKKRKKKKKRAYNCVSQQLHVIVLGLQMSVPIHEEGGAELSPMVDSGNWESLPLVMYPIVIQPGSSRQSQYNSHKMAKLNGSQNQTRSRESGKGTELGVVWVSQGIILKYCQPRVKHKFIALTYQYAQIFLIALAMLWRAG